MLRHPIDLRKIIPNFLAALCLFGSTAALADGLDLNPEELRGSSSKKPISVLQSRYFLKTWRPEVGLLYGTFLNEAYTSTSIQGLRLGVFFNEWVGIEYQYIQASTKDSEDRKALNKKKYRDYDDPTIVRTPDTEVNKVKGMTDLAVIGAPFYGKLNLLDYLIIYADLYGTLGLSQVSTEQGTKSAIILGGGQRFYIGDRWSTRIDFRDRTYTERRAGETSRKNAWCVDFGVSYFFL